MSAPDGFLTERRVAIIGLGLMGGSLALALRGRVKELLAADPDPATRALARQRRVVDQIVADPVEIIPLAEVIILAAPVQAILAHIQLLGDLARRSPWLSNTGPAFPPIVLDLGSTKQEIVAALDTLPAEYDPLGGHPMCGKELSGLAQAEAEIYHGATFAFTSLERTSPRARMFAGLLADAVGAAPLWIDPATHDRWVAATSHLPYLLANALAGVTPVEAAALIGPGFRSTSRLAPASPTVMLDILRTNRQPVLAALQRFQVQVEAITSALAGDDFTGLARLLADGAQRYRSLLQPQ